MRFAHVSDLHLGFQRKRSLQEAERRIFEGMVDGWIKGGARFVLMAGDIFHVNIPEMRVQRYVFAKFRQLHEAGIPAYAIYGSHDFSPVSNSVIDLLVSTGYVTKVTDAVTGEDGAITPKFTTDPGTGAKICGISGLKVGRDIDYYKKLDRKGIEAEPGFKIFMFHGAISEMRKAADEGDHMPMSMLPAGFDYYAGGHVHEYGTGGDDSHGVVAYPGTPFAGNYADLVASADGTARGYIMADSSGEKVSVEFVGSGGPGYVSISVSAEGRSPQTVNEEMERRAGKADPDGRIVVVRVRGEMSEGKTSDVDTARVSLGLLGRGALAVEVGRNMLTSRKYKIDGARGESREEIVRGVLESNIGQVKTGIQELAGKRGVRMAEELLRRIGQPKIENEDNKTYDARMITDGSKTMGLSLDDP
ncbi:MAG: DNA repair exonuclease [Nitrosopumilus sp.]|nr:DNA repair exonuclease [Nitrosopumilus sp.]